MPGRSQLRQYKDEEVGQVFAESFGGAGAGFFLGVVRAEVRMVALTGRF